MDRQKICKCGNAYGELLWKTRALEDDLKRLERSEYYDYPQGSLEESINGIYKNIRDTEDYCSINTTLEQQHIIDAYNKIPLRDNIEEIFTKNKDIILEDLSKIRFGIREKMKVCSK